MCSSDLNVAEAEILAAISPGDKFKLDIDDTVVALRTARGERVGIVEVRLATRLRKKIGRASCRERV